MQHLNLEYFLVIVECGSLTKAAEKLYVSQSSLSQYLKRLEGSLGVALFDRSSSPMRLTLAGERYYIYANRARQMEQDIRQEMADLRDEVRGRVRLGVAFWRGACMLPDFFPEFHINYPGIRLELTEGSAHKMEAALLDDSIDLAIMNLPQRLNLNYDRLTTETIIEEPILLVVPGGHPAVQKILSVCKENDNFPVAPISLVNELPLIFTQRGQNLTLKVNEFLLNNDLHPEVILETGNLTTAINLAAHGMGGAFVPAEGARTCRHPDQLIFFQLDTPDLIWPLAAVYRRERYLGRLPRLLIDAAKTALSDKKF